jgi:hypothetical protein
MAVSYPPIFINDYLAEKILNDSRFEVNIPFFPVAPSDIEQLTEFFPEGMYAVYDRMFKMRRGPFPHIKSEQLLYYFYKMFGDPELLIETTQAVSDLLDRGDESAQDLNSWISSKLTKNEAGESVYSKSNGNSEVKEYLPVYFHDFKIFQLEETRDIIDFATARTYAGNKVIIDYRYHTKGYPKGQIVRNEDGSVRNPERPRYEGASNATYNDTAI